MTLDPFACDAALARAAADLTVAHLDALLAEHAIAAPIARALRAVREARAMIGRASAVASRASRESRS